MITAAAGTGTVSGGAAGTGAAVGGAVGAGVSGGGAAAAGGKAANGAGLAASSGGGDQRRRPGETNVPLRADMNRAQIRLCQLVGANDVRREEHDDVRLDDGVVRASEQVPQDRQSQGAGEPP